MYAAALWAVGILAAGVIQVAATTPERVPGASIRGSPEAMQEQHRVALEQGLPFFHTEDEIRAAVAEERLVDLPGSFDYDVADFVTLPYLIPEGRLFVERTAALYRDACGEPLVVTSAVRAIQEQPPNAHALSVHPAGMAIDFRVSQAAECREWLENKILALEQQGVVNGIREFHPPHYHVAVYPTAYTAYVEEQEAAATFTEEPVDPRRPFGFWTVLAFLAGLAGFLFLASRWARGSR